MPADLESTAVDVPVTGHERSRRWYRAALGALLAMMIGASCYLLVAQVDVDGGAGVGGAGCGSVLDTITDRTGWEAWWQADLDDVELGRIDEPVRSTSCPDRVNNRLIVVSILVALAVGAGIALRRSNRDPTRVRGSLERWGAVMTVAGSAIVVVGAAALLVVLADADAVLYEHVDRWVVVAGGALILAPAIAVAALGRVISALAEGLGDPPADRGARDV